MPCIFPLHLPITTQSTNNKSPDIDSGLRAITAVELYSIKRKCVSITQRNAACSTYSRTHTRTRIMHSVCAFMCVLSNILRCLPFFLYFLRFPMLIINTD